MDRFRPLSPILQALLATCFTWGVTAAGAGLVFVFKSVNRKVLDGMLAFAVMMTLDVALGRHAHVLARHTGNSIMTRVGRAALRQSPG